MKTLVRLFALLLISQSAFAKIAVIMPADYETRSLFLKVSSAFSDQISEKIYDFQICEGSLQTGTCKILARLSESRLAKVELQKNLYGSALMAAEMAVGFGLWKNLVRLTLPAFYKVVQRSTGWSEGVAIGTVALVPATLTSAGAVVLTTKNLHRMYQNIDPNFQFQVGNLFDQKIYDNAEEVIVSKLSSDQIVQLLKR